MSRELSLNKRIILLSAIKTLKNGKAAGLDKQTSEFFKASPEDPQKLLLRMLNLMYTKHHVPKNKNQGVITPVHKDGPKDDPDNH